VRILAHGVGQSQDLPLPLDLVLQAGAATVVVSFLVVAVWWQRPRLGGGGERPDQVSERPSDRGGWRPVARLLVLLAALYLVGNALAGPRGPGNPAAHALFVWLWVGLVPVSVVFGPVWRQLNPVRAIHAGINRLARLDPAEGLRPLPPGIGYWPAALGLFGFTWMELIYPDNATLTTFRLAVGLYAVLHLFAGFLYGSAWFDRADAFETWSGLFGRFSVLGRRSDGTRVWRSPLAGLDALEPAPGLIATVMVMLGSTAYDGFSGSPQWQSYVQSASPPRMLLETGALLGVVLLLTALYAACTTAAGRLAGGSGRGMPVAFVHSVVPVALGYVVAHYYTLFAYEGQRGLARLGDPLSTGADWFGLADLTPNPAPITPALVAAVQVLAVVSGHVIGVVLAHDRAVRLFPRTAAVIGQLPLLILMVTLTCTGLILLFAALADDRQIEFTLFLGAKR
jgi:hypothetical protein